MPSCKTSLMCNVDCTRIKTLHCDKTKVDGSSKNKVKLENQILADAIMNIAADQERSYEDCDKGKSNDVIDLKIKKETDKSASLNGGGDISENETDKKDANLKQDGSCPGVWMGTRKRKRSICTQHESETTTQATLKEEDSIIDASKQCEGNSSEPQNKLGTTFSTSNQSVEMKNNNPPSQNPSYKSTNVSLTENENIVAVPPTLVPNPILFQSLKKEDMGNVKTDVIKDEPRGIQVEETLSNCMLSPQSIATLCTKEKKKDILTTILKNDEHSSSSNNGIGSGQQKGKKRTFRDSLSQQENTLKSGMVPMPKRPVASSCIQIPPSLLSSNITSSLPCIKGEYRKTSISRTTNHRKIHPLQNCLKSCLTKQIKRKVNKKLNIKGKLYSSKVNPIHLGISATMSDAVNGSSIINSILLDDIQSSTGKENMMEDLLRSSAKEDELMNVPTRSRGMSFELFSFGMNEDELTPPMNNSSSTRGRPRGDSIIFDPVSFADGGIHEKTALSRSLNRSTALGEIDEIEIMNTPGFGEGNISSNTTTKVRPMTDDTRSHFSGSSLILGNLTSSEHMINTYLGEKPMGEQYFDCSSASTPSLDTIESNFTSKDVSPLTMIPNVCALSNVEETIHMPQGSAAAAAAAISFPNGVIPSATNGNISHAACPIELLNYGGRVGIYLPDARQDRIAKFHAKRKMRIWRKRIKYDCRKKLADSRPRIKGRFVKSLVYD